MVLPLRNPKPIWREWWPLISGFTLGGTVTLSLMVAVSPELVLSLPNGTHASWKEACDRAVANLLYSGDPIELQRSDILIRRLDCSVTRRLPLAR